MSVFVSDVASGAVMSGPRALPGSIDGSVVLQTGKVAAPVGIGRFRLEVPPGQAEVAANVGIEMPPVGMPMPVMMRSCSRRFRPARMLSAMSSRWLTFWFEYVAVLKARMVAPRATRVTAMATVNSMSVNPVCFFIANVLIRSSGERRDVADQCVGAVQFPNLVINSDGDHPQVRLARHWRDGDGARHPRV